MKEERGMKWYKFLIYFALFAAAAVNMVSLALSIVDLVNILGMGVTDGRIKGALATVIIYCAYLVILSAFLIVTRFSLARFECDGPMLLICIYIADFVISIAYCIAWSYILGKSAFGIYQIIILVIYAVMAHLNYIYFEHRSNLFVNKEYC